MFCQDEWKKSFAQSIYMAGMLVGSFIFGFLADHIGRRPTIVIGAFLLSGSGTICALLPSSPSVYPAFVALRFLAGMGHVGTFMMSFTLSLEYVGIDKRTFCGVLIEIPFAIGKKRKLPFTKKRSRNS
jgi:MFS family permease